MPPAAQPDLDGCHCTDHFNTLTYLCSFTQPYLLQILRRAKAEAAEGARVAAVCRHGLHRFGACEHDHAPLVPMHKREMHRRSHRVLDDGTAAERLQLFYLMQQRLVSVSTMRMQRARIAHARIPPWAPVSVTAFDGLCNYHVNQCRCPPAFAFVGQHKPWSF